MVEYKNPPTLEIRPAEINPNSAYQGIGNKFRKARAGTHPDRDEENLAASRTVSPSRASEVSIESLGTSLSRRPEWETGEAEHSAYQSPKVGR